MVICSLAILFFTMAVAPSLVSACPNCKDGVANDPNHANMIRGYQMSIIFMMMMPFLILSGLGTYFYLEIRKARALQAAQEPTLGSISKLEM